MELWVRSQDKEKLGKVCLIEYSKDDYGYHLFGWHDKFDGHSLGTYKSKERALEILDEIQNKLKNEDNDLINKLKILGNTPIVNCMNNDDCEINVNIELLKNMIIYEMPEE